MKTRGFFFFHCEGVSIAREQSSNVLTLSVINGNRSRRLYERFGFEAVVPKTYINAACEQCIVGCIVGCMVCCLVGRPYGVCDPHFGYVEMRMPLLWRDSAANVMQQRSYYMEGFSSSSSSSTRCSTRCSYNTSNRISISNTSISSINNRRPTKWVDRSTLALSPIIRS